MKRFLGPLGLSLALVAVPISSEADSPDDRMRQGYVFTAPGVLSGLDVGTLEVGGGFQWMTYRGWSLGFDASLMGLPDCFYCGGLVLGSFDAAYHFAKPSRRLAPFVLGGFGGVFTGEDAVPFVGFGGGINYWLDRGIAFRIEVRDRVISEGVHSLGMRLGVTF